MNQLIERPYQIRILEAARKSLAKNKHVIIYAPQGSGKSVIAASMARGASKKGNKTAILTHRVEILNQDFKKMEMLGLNVAIINRYTAKIPDADIYCISIQTMASRCNRLEEWREFAKRLDFIIEDECHRGEFSSMHKYFKDDVWAIGLSGTVLRSGNMEQLGDFYSDIVAPVYPKELIELGNILPSSNFIFDAPKLDDISVDYSSGDYNQKQLQSRFAKSERYAGIIENYNRICPGAKVIVFATGSTHCIELTKEFCDVGIKAKYLLSERFPDTDKEFSGERSHVLHELAHGDTNVIISVEMLSTGLDVPQLEGVILDYSTKSYTKYQQCVARADRPYQNQTSFFVLDFGNNVKTFGIFEADPIMALYHKVGGNGVAPSKFCPTDRPDHTGKLGCGRILPVSMMICKYCQYEWLTDTQIYEVELTKMVEGVNYEDETVQGFCARKKLEGWNNNRILCAVVFKNKDNQKKSFMDAIQVLRGTNGEYISPTYWFFFKKTFIDKYKKKES